MRHVKSDEMFEFKVDVRDSLIVVGDETDKMNDVGDFAGEGIVVVGRLESSVGGRKCRGAKSPRASGVQLDVSYWSLGRRGRY
jgi:hypothetical protein